MGDTNFHPWVWAEKALHKFRESLGFSPIFSQDKLTAVLIGKSQEGKTSLALRLLGAGGEKVAELEKALRGGRPEGFSATPFPIIYKAIGGEITEAKLWEIKEKIKNLWEQREELKNKEFEVIELPIEGGIVANIIDLIGLEAREEKEQELAKEKAKKWLYYADFLIYVCGADHIADFTSFDPEIKEIMNRWEVNKDTSLFAITLAYETDTVKKIIKGIKDPKELKEKVSNYFKEKILEQFKREGRNLTINDIPKVLPLCLKTDEKNVIYKEATTIALNEIKEIIERDPLKFKIRAGFTYPQQLKREIVRKQQELKRKKEEEDSHIKKKKEKIEIQKKNISFFEDRIKKIEEKKKTIEGLPKTLLNSLVEELEKVKLKEPKCEIGEKVQRIQEAALEYKKEIIKTINKKVEEIKKYFSKEELEINKTFNYIIGNINGYLKERYYKVEKGDVIVEGWFWGVKWEESVKNLFYWQEETYKGVIRILEKDFKELFFPICEKEIYHLERGIKNYGDGIKNAKGIIKEIEKEIEEEETKRKEEIKKLEEEISKGEEFLEKSRFYKKYLLEEFISFWNRIVNLLNNSVNIIEILNLLYQLWIVQKTFEECCSWEKEAEQWKN